ncbi:hypothetical protein FRC00_009284, partial [Tulasnella sp. 408]
MRSRKASKKFVTTSKGVGTLADLERFKPALAAGRIGRDAALQGHLLELLQHMPPERKREVISHLPNQIFTDCLSVVSPAQAAAQLSSLLPPDRHMDVINAFPDLTFALDVDEQISKLASSQHGLPPAAAAPVVLHHSAAAPVSQQQIPSVVNRKTLLAQPLAATSSKPPTQQLPTATEPLLISRPPQPATSGQSVAAITPGVANTGPVTPTHSTQPSKPVLGSRSRAVAWTPSPQAGLPRAHPSAMADEGTVLKRAVSPASPTPTKPKVDAGLASHPLPRLTPREPDVYASHSEHPLIAAEFKPSPGSPDTQKPVARVGALYHASSKNQRSLSPQMPAKRSQDGHKDDAGPQPSSSASPAPTDAAHGDTIEVDLPPRESEA